MGRMRERAARSELVSRTSFKPMVQGSNPCAGTNRFVSRNPHWTVECGFQIWSIPALPSGMRVSRQLARPTGRVLCLLWALSQSTVVTEPQPPHCTLVRLLSAYRRLPAGVAAPGPVNRALGANELAEDAHLHLTKLLIDLVGLQTHPAFPRGNLLPTPVDRSYPRGNGA